MRTKTAGAGLTLIGALLVACGGKTASDSGNGANGGSSFDADGGAPPGALTCTASLEAGEKTYTLTDGTLTIHDGSTLSQEAITRLGSAPDGGVALLGTWQIPAQMTGGVNVSVVFTFTESTLTAVSTCTYGTTVVHATASSPVTYATGSYDVQNDATDSERND